MMVLDGSAINERLADLNVWEVRDGKLYKRYELANFKEALDLVNAIGKAAEELGHHPDVGFGWGWVEIRIVSHDAGGITERDFTLASRIDSLGRA